jgi:hypothetical protein
MIRTMALAFTLTVVAVGTLHAQADTVNACTDDKSKLCANVPSGGGRVIACLVNQKDKISAGCTKLLVSMGKLK